MLSDFDRIRLYNEVLPEFKSHGCTPFNLECLVEDGYKESKNRILLVLEHIETESLRNKRLLSGQQELKFVRNLISYSMKQCESITGKKIDAKFAVINFHAFKTYHLDTSTTASAEEYAAKRIQRIIYKTKPHKVLVFGDKAAARLIESDFVPQKRGWVFRQKVKTRSYYIASTLQYTKLLYKEEMDSIDDAVDRSNIAGYMSRNIINLLNEDIVFKLDVGVRPLLVDTIGKFNKMMRRLDTAKYIAVDVETQGLSVHKNSILTIQFAINSKAGYVLPILHKESPFVKKEIKYITKKIKEFFSRGEKETEDKYLIMQNGSFDIRIIRKAFNIAFMYWPVWDTMAGEHGLDENIKILNKYGTPQFGLGAMTTAYGDDFYLTAEVSKKNRDDVRDSLDKSVLMYCAADVQFCFAIHRLQQERSRHMMFGKKSYEEPYKKLVLYVYGTLAHQIAEKELYGCGLNMKKLVDSMDKNSWINTEIDKTYRTLYKRQSCKEVNSSLIGQTQDLFGNALWSFDINKKAHLQSLLIDNLKLEPLHYGKSGAPSINKEFLEKYSSIKEVSLLSTIRSLSKIRSTYIEPFYKIATQSIDGSADHRIRASYGFTHVVTGRTNSYSPNLQNRPEHAEFSKNIKELFIASKGKLLVKFDFSASEVCWWGLISKDKNIASMFNSARKLKQIFRADPTQENRDKLKFEGDIHRRNYSSFTGKDIMDVTSEERQDSKGVTFGAIYGKTVKSTARDLGRKLEEMESISNAFFSANKSASNWLSWTKKFSRKTLYTASPFGRRRNLYGHLLGESNISQALDRRAANSPIQGISSDNSYFTARMILKTLHEYIDNGILETSKVNINNMIHDSTEIETLYEHTYLVTRVIENSVLKVREELERIFNMKLLVPLSVDIEIGSSGGSMEPWDGTHQNFKEVMQKALEYKKSMGEDINIHRIIDNTLQNKKRIDELYPI